MVEVVGAIIWREGRMLICQRPVEKAQGGLWEFPGGKVEVGESPQDALVRECREELNVELDVGEEFMQVTHAYPTVTIHLTLFHAHIRSGSLTCLEHQAYAWITPQEATNYTFCPADVPVVERLSHAKS